MLRAGAQAQVSLPGLGPKFAVSTVFREHAHIRRSLVLWASVSSCVQQSQGECWPPEGAVRRAPRLGFTLRAVTLPRPPGFLWGWGYRQFYREETWSGTTRTPLLGPAMLCTHGTGRSPFHSPVGGVCLGPTDAIAHPSPKTPPPPEPELLSVRAQAQARFEAQLCSDIAVWSLGCHLLL